MSTLQITVTNVATPVYSLWGTLLLTFAQSVGQTIADALSRGR